MVGLASFLKRNSNYLAGILLISIVIFLTIRGKIYSDRINENGSLCYGIIIEEGRPMTYYYVIDGKRFMGNINSQNNLNKIGDTLIIQYSTRYPILHIVHSKKGKLGINQVKKKVVRIWDAI